MRFLAVITLTAALFLLLTADTLAAAQRFEVSADFDVAETGKVAVTKTYTVTNTTADALDSLTVVAPSTQLSALNARYPDGTEIPAQTSLSQSRSGDVQFEHQAIKLEFPRRQRGVGTSWQFTLSYVADEVVGNFGGVRSLHLPGIGLEVPEAAYGLTLRYPDSFAPARLLPEGVRTGSEGGKRFVSLERGELPAKTLATVFGDSANYGVTLTLPLRNHFILPRNLKVALPPELSSQRLESLQFDPAPTNTTLDKDGNLYGIWRLGPFQSQTVKVGLRFKAEHLRYDFAQSGTSEDIPAELADYTRPNRYWPNSRSVQQAAAELMDDEATVAATVQTVGAFVAETFRPRVEQFDFNHRRNGSAILAGDREINALEYSDVTISLLRSLGVPARLVLGQTAPSVLTPSDGRHAWVEAYVPGVGWVSLDPFWFELYQTFDYHYLDRVGLYVLGDKAPPSAARLPLLEGDEIGVIGLDTERETSEPEVSAQATRYVLLPGVVLNSVRLAHDSTRPSDGIELAGFDRTIQLGSFAPFETKTFRHLSFGDMGPLELTLSQEEEALASVEADPNWWWLIALGGVLATSLLVLQWRRSQRRSSPSSITHPSPAAREVNTDEEDRHAAERYHE